MAEDQDQLSPGEESDHVAVGDAFPEIELDTPDGSTTLTERLSDGPVVLAFERHFG